MNDEATRTRGIADPRPGGDGALTRRVRHDLAAFAYPAVPWTRGPDGVLDVLIVGAGQAGLATALRLARESVRDVLVLDAAPTGREGPWSTWARMPTLRTPKELYGTEAGIQAASFRAWYDDRHGVGAFDELRLIPRLEWRDYLCWLREAAGLEVRNDTRVTAAEPDGAHWRVTTEGPGGTETLRTRKIVACTGMTGAGGPRVPAFLAPLRPGRAAHSSDAIDFAALAGRAVAVLGLGASAFDNAATALEHGARRVVQLGRRAELPTRNAFRQLERKGLFRAFHTLPDHIKRAFAREEFALPTPPTGPSLERCRAHAGYELRLGTDVTGATAADSGVRLRTGPGTPDVDADFVIAATGFQVDLGAVDWLAPLAGHILRWSDVLPTAEGGAAREPDRPDRPDRLDRLIGAHPKLGPGMACRPRTAEAPAALRNLHLFNLAAHVDYGIACIGLNGLPQSADNVTQAVCADLLAEDAPRLLAGFRAFADGASAAGPHQEDAR
ncbi:NAD(P)-binding domain-containing protein [Streptomyces radicis]|uniref:NAD(P)/FAD-dependent oxidoreductase n=1 Tax=Streptomyces radicis TaxID=1750517 RepID=A0A3A9WHC8_9ACTN|nr:NAD(P)/FAD-dependent oxidoreductase [Streptomyces radicis]RKN12428.1 NAD(P)/FAD-dependent oxidoreductase [Streptomyces radicis]RKN27802.1 NAD(P)/FAD-dependent oxidoreductase [Streptomyces radicis]